VVTKDQVLEEFTKAKKGDLAHPVYALHFVTINVPGDRYTDVGLTLWAADILDNTIHAMAEEIAKLRNER
jgi:hypothetical protein